MSFNCGIVGLPNVGKSTLFNALTRSANAQAANYPFCTIEPNIGRVGVPDPRLEEIAQLSTSQKIIPAFLEFVDIAGLVKGASKGEGLGNQFLGHIRSVDAIIQVLRCFEDDDITHVEKTIDPLRDKEIIETELLLADLASLHKRKEALTKRAKSDPEAKDLLHAIEELLPHLEKGTVIRKIELSPDILPFIKDLHLLTSKPMLYVLNVRESEAVSGNSWTKALEESEKTIIISAAIEAEISLLNQEDQTAFLESLGLKETGLDQVIKKGYDLLNLLTFFTAGPKEARAWTLSKGLKVPQAAGVIHSDFEKGFICAETVSYADFVKIGGWTKAKEAGFFRQEGKDYVPQDGDIFHFRFNV